MPELTLTPVAVGTLGGGITTVYNLSHQGSTLGFYGVTPVTRPSAYTQTYSTADKTHAARTSDGLSDSTGGVASGGLVDATGSDTVDFFAVRDNFSTLNAELDKLRADSVDTARLVNAILTDLKALGLLQ